MVKRMLLIGALAAFCGGSALATDAPMPRYVEVSSDATSPTGQREVVIQRFAQSGDQGRERADRRGGPTVMMMGPMGGRGGAMMGGPMMGGQQGGVMVRCTRADLPDGPNDEKRYSLNCSERKLEKGETVYVRPDMPIMMPPPPEPPVPPVPPAR